MNVAARHLDRGDNLAGGAQVVDLAAARARKEAADSWDALMTPPTPAAKPEPTVSSAKDQGKVWGSQAAWRGDTFPLPQRPASEGRMDLPRGFKPINKPGRCLACGFHVPTQMHRTFCPNTGLDGNASQAKQFRGLRG